MSTSHLIVYNAIYNSRLIISANYTTSVATCENLEAQVDDSIRVLGYNDPAVEGTTVTFHCPPGLVLDEIKSLTCMKNGEWSVALHKLSCTGISI